MLHRPAAILLELPGQYLAHRGCHFLAVQMYSRFQNAWLTWQMANGVMSQQMAILYNRHDVIASSKTNSDVSPFGRSAICYIFWPTILKSAVVSIVPRPYLSASGQYYYDRMCYN